MLSVLFSNLRSRQSNTAKLSKRTVCMNLLPCVSFVPPSSTSPWSILQTFCYLIKLTSGNGKGLEKLVIFTMPSEQKIQILLPLLQVSEVKAIVAIANISGLHHLSRIHLLPYKRFTRFGCSASTNRQQRGTCVLYTHQSICCWLKGLSLSVTLLYLAAGLNSPGTCFSWCLAKFNQEEALV